MTRGYNFGAGPAMLPQSVLERCQAELLDYHGTGMSVMEIGHRQVLFSELVHDTEQRFRSLLAIPDDYSIAMLGGAARYQFNLIPLNFLKSGEEALYYCTGFWSQHAADEATLLCKDSGMINTISNLEQFPAKAKDYRYLWYTPNETIDGVYTHYPKQVSGMPIIADMTSCLLGEQIRVGDFALILAGAQKNIANAGMSVLIAHNDFIAQARDDLPASLSLKQHFKHHSLLVTPPTFNIYMTNLMLQWIAREGGIAVLEARNRAKAKALYAYLDASSYYEQTVAPERRSIFNVPFDIYRPELEDKFTALAKEHGLYNLKGHATRGGLRASLYNSMPIEGVNALIRFMAYFAQENP